DHLDHSARRTLHRGINGEAFPCGIAVRGVAIQTVQAQRSRNHSHRVHELVDRETLEHLHVFEEVVRHLRFWFRSTLAARDADAQKAHHYDSRDSNNYSFRSYFHVVSLPAWFVSRAVYVGN